MAEMCYSSEREYAGHLKVNACGKLWLSDKDRDILRENGRVDFSVYYISSGSGRCVQNGRETVVPEGCLMLYFPQKEQRYSFRKQDAAVMMFAHFSGTAGQMLGSMISDSAVILKVQDQRQFESAFEKMISAYYQKETYFDSVCAGYMTVLVSLMAQSWESEALSKNASNENLKKVISLMYTYYNRPIDIQAYAKLCCLSQVHFIRVFKAYTGVTPYHYQLKIRIDRAIEMLENTSITVGQCAECVGFHDSAYFSRVMKRMTGHPPSFYK